MKRHSKNIYDYMFSLRFVLLPVWLLVVGGVLAWLNQANSDQPALNISAAHIASDGSHPVAIRFSGENFTRDVNGYLTELVYSPPEPSWQLFDGSAIGNIAIDGNLAFVSAYQKRLISLQLNGQNPPRVIGSVPFDELIDSIVIAGDKAVVGMARKGGIAIVDISDPAAMEITARVQTAGSVFDMVNVGKQVYYTDAKRGVGRIDLAADAPQNEIILNIEKPWRLAADQKMLAVSTINSHLYLVDMSDPQNVRARASQIDYSGKHKGYIRDIDIVGESLVVASADRKLMTYSITDKMSLDAYKTLELPAVPYRMETMKASDRGAVSLVGRGVAMIDVAADGVLKLAAQLHIPTTPLSFSLDKERLYLSGRWDYLGLNAFVLPDSMDTEDVSDIVLDSEPLSFVSVDDVLFGYSPDEGLIKISPRDREVSVSSKEQLLAADSNGIAIFAASDDGSEMIRRGSYVGPSRDIDTVVRDEYLFLMHKNGLNVYGGQTDDHKALVGQLNLDGLPVKMASISDDYLFIVTKSAGLKVIDVSLPRSPRVVCELVPPVHLQSVTIGSGVVINGPVAYVSMGAAGVHVVDIQNPARIKLRHIIDTPGIASGMAIKDDLLMVADGAPGVFLLDIRDRFNPIQIGNIPTPIYVRSIATSRDSMYVSGHPGGTLKLPLPVELRNTALSRSNELVAELDRFSKPGVAYLYNERYRQQVHVGAN